MMNSSRTYASPNWMHRIVLADLQKEAGWTDLLNALKRPGYYTPIGMAAILSLAYWFMQAGGTPNDFQEVIQQVQTQEEAQQQLSERIEDTNPYAMEDMSPPALQGTEQNPNPETQPEKGKKPPAELSNRFPEIAKKTLDFEQGEYNDPRVEPAPKGDVNTNRGITITTYKHYLRRKYPNQDINALLRKYPLRKISVETALEIYKEGYWDSIEADSLPHPVDEHLFDFSINSGPARAIQHIQRVVGAEVDGQMGPLTQKAIQQYVSRHGAKKLARELSLARLRFTKSLKDKRHDKGWTNRINALIQSLDS